MKVLTNRPLPQVGVPVDPAPSDDSEALLKEARRRRRRRNLMRNAAGVVVIGVVWLSAAAWGGEDGGHGSHVPVIPHPKTKNSERLPSCNANRLVATVSAGQGGPVQELGELCSPLPTGQALPAKSTASRSSNS